MPTGRCRLVIALLVASALLLAGCGGTEGGPSAQGPTPTPMPPPPAPEIPTYSVTRGTVVDEVIFSGRVSPVVEHRLFFQVAGRVKGVYVQRDDIVEAGTLLAELENDDLLRQLDQANIDLATAENNLQAAVAQREYSVRRAEIDLEMKRLQLAKVQASVSDADLQIAAANLQKAEAALKIAQAAYDRRVGQGGGVEASGEALNLERATIDYQIAQASYNRTAQQQRMAPYDVEMQRLQVQLAEMELERLQNAIDVQLVNAVERTRLTVERVEAQLAQTQVISPIAGKVTAAAATVGSNITAYKELFIIADESVLDVTGDPRAEDLQRLSEGLPVEITFNQFPDQVVQGVISRLPYPYGSGGSGSVQEADTFTHVTYDAADLPLKPGNVCNVRATLEVKDDALWLPPVAVRDFGGRRFVVIDEGGQQRRVDVTVGIQSPDRIEILTGLEEGQVVLAP
jgi:multidrug efflux pump subunit AcrA (membrane-fusion protein)